MRISSLLLYFILLTISCRDKEHSIKNLEYESENLAIKIVGPSTLVHTTYLQSESFGKVACNGLIVFDRNEAVIFDTPPDDQTSAELINWITDILECRIKAVVPTHFHLDCLGGLKEFHKHGINSYANAKTIQSAKASNFEIPKNSFDDSTTMIVGSKEIRVIFPGEGHTRDNVVAYVPEEEALFGGCLIKEVGAGEGNLADANVNAWPSTMENIKQRFPRLKVIVPGHGKPGGTELLDYTQDLFKKE